MDHSLLIFISYKLLLLCVTFEPAQKLVLYICNRFEQKAFKEKLVGFNGLSVILLKYSGLAEK